jgi:type III secretory pathway component EscU
VLLLIAKGVMPVADAISKSGAVIRQPTHSAICWCRR